MMAQHPTSDSSRFGLSLYFMRRFVFHKTRGLRMMFRSCRSVCSDLKSIVAAAVDTFERFGELLERSIVMCCAVASAMKVRNLARAAKNETE